MQYITYMHKRVTSDLPLGPGYNVQDYIRHDSLMFKLKLKI